MGRRDALAVLHLLRWNWSTYLATYDEDESTYAPVEVWIYSWMGDHARAVQMAERALDLGPNDPAPQRILGVAYAYAGNRAASTEMLGKSL